MRLALLLSAMVLAANIETASPELLAFDRKIGAAPTTPKAKLRRELDVLAGRVPSTTANRELLALLRSRLADSGAPVSPAQSATLAAGRLRFERGDYAGALAYAESVLATDPANAAALGLKRMSAGRSRGAAAPATAGEPMSVLPPTTAATAASSDADKPYRLAAKPRPTMGKVPELPARDERTNYISPDAKKPGTIKHLFNGIASNIAYLLHKRTPQEAARIDAVKRLLTATPTGQRLVSELGGWNEISRRVDVTFAPMTPKNLNAYVRPLDLAGSRYALVLNTDLLSHPDEVIAPILAHELSHLMDASKGGLGGGLAIPSELSAHRQQVYVFKELEAGLTADKRALLAKDSKWDYNQFIADLWQDKILQRFPTERAFTARFLTQDMSRRAQSAYFDLANKVVAPGSPHLDYHLTAPDSGVYSVLSDEKDILNLVEAKKKRGSYAGTERELDERLLSRRAALINEADRFDSDYRQQNGYQLDE